MHRVGETNLAQVTAVTIRGRPDPAAVGSLRRARDPDDPGLP